MRDFGSAPKDISSGTPQRPFVELQ